ncbi:MAG: hypothetical protein J5651_00325 [Salinivirgaceae bacterium]|nr:hypothetical protein [Salinivirgaceae bacterium]
MNTETTTNSELILGVFTPNSPILSTDPRLLTENGGWFKNHRAVLTAAHNKSYGFFRANGVRCLMIMPEDLERALVGNKAKFEPLR